MLERESENVEKPHMHMYAEPSVDGKQYIELSYYLCASQCSLRTQSVVAVLGVKLTTWQRKKGYTVVVSMLTTTCKESNP